jgi:putative flippase GtrA
VDTADLTRGRARVRRLLWFCVSGGLAFVIDAGLLHLLLAALPIDPYSARLVSVLVAMTFTWVFNRSITFADRRRSGVPLREWMAWVSTQSAGFAVNYATYALLVFSLPAVREWPVLGVAAGSLAGLVVNYVAASRLVFRER